MKATVDRLLKVTEAAARLDVHKSTIYRLIYANQLPVVPVGLGKSRPRVRISEAALDAFMTRGVAA
jgi:excisionase family DNA binding protein